MREKKQLVPLLLAIVLLFGVLLLIIPNGPFAGLLDDGPDQPSPNDPDIPKDEPSDPSEPSKPHGPTTQQPSESGDAGDQQDPSKPPHQSAVTVYEYPINVSAYLPAISTVYDNILLVNKTHPLSATSSPGIIRTLDDDLTLYGKEVQLEITAATALEAMLLCMRADGITDTYVTSGYRSYQYQLMLQNTYIKEEQKKDPTLSREEALAVVRTYSAAPGSSEHQSGLCVDLMTTGMSDLDKSFESTEAFAWLQKNACQFGFILRYPKGKEHITGYTYEPWHYRFVGREAAMAITSAGLTLEEYLTK